jgi:hypothetical protein
MGGGVHGRIGGNMRRHLLGALAALTLVSAPLSAGAQTAQGGTPEATKPGPSRTVARPQREPTAGQMAARERQRKCGAEWKEAKAGGKTGGLKWPQYWSKCNARLKGSHV